jgi:hypothetical protein
MISKMKADLSPDSHRDLVVQFLAEIMQETIEVKGQEAFQQALQNYCDRLRPWLLPNDGPPNPRAVFSLLEDCAFDDTNENVTVVLSPEAQAFFRAWLRRNQIWSDAGLHTAHAWSN